MINAIGTLIHGCAATEHIDSSGERISIEGLDISSLPIDGLFNYEHKSDVPAQVVGKILLAKKIFKKEDCETPEQLYFFEKCKGTPYVYVMGELFDGVGHKGAQEVAAMFKYDALARKNGRESKNVANFSIEGSKLDKDGNNITKSLARKVTITTLACNKAAIAELFQDSKKTEKSESILDFTKSESSAYEYLHKDAKLFSFPKPKSPFGKVTVKEDKPQSFGKVTVKDNTKIKTPTLTAQQNQSVDSQNKFITKDPGQMASYKKQLANIKVAERQARAGIAPKRPTPEGMSPTAPKKLFDPDLSRSVYFKKSSLKNELFKALTAGSGMAAPANKVQGDALAKEDMLSHLEELPNFKTILNKVKEKYPDMSEDEAKSVSKYMAARQMIRSEEAMEKMMDLDKSKNVREQRAKIFGTRGDPGKASKFGQKQIGALKDLAERRYGMEVVPSRGKIDPQTGKRKDFNPKQVGGALKPDWRSGKFESQMNPQAVAHEAAHLELAPEKMTLPEIQEMMDQRYREIASKYGARQKQTQEEIQPMAAENPIRRRAGVPAFARPQYSDPTPGKSKSPITEDTPERISLDTKQKYGVRLKDDDGDMYDLVGVSQNLSPENKERMIRVDEGSLKYDPEMGWVESSSPDALVNLRGRGKVDEVKERLKQKYLSQKNNKLAASEEMKKGKIGPECKTKLKAYSKRRGWQWPNAVTALQSKRICGSKKK